MIIFINFSIFSSIKRKACGKNRLNPRQMPGALFRLGAWREGNAQNSRKMAVSAF